MRRLSSWTKGCQWRGVKQVGQVPVVGRREGVVVVLLEVGSGPVARKCVARQVRWETLLQDGAGQTRVLAPEVGMAEEQRVQVWGVARMFLLFSSCDLRGACVTSKA